MSKKTKEQKQAEKEAKRKASLEKAKKQSNSFWADFKKFISRGNIVDLSVAVVIGAAFNSIVKGLVDFIITPVISYLTGGLDMTEWKYELHREIVDGEEVITAIQWGSLIQAVINFLIVAMVVFLTLRIYTKVEKRAKELLKKEELEKKKAEEQKKKEEEAAKAKALAEQQAALDAREAEFYKNVARQTELLEQIAARLSVK